MSDINEDDRISDEVRRRLGESPMIDAAGVEVMVAEGEVFLTGLVPDRAQRQHAEDVVRTILGVRRVYDRLEVPRPGPPVDPFDSEPAWDVTVTGTTRPSATGGSDVTS